MDTWKPSAFPSGKSRAASICPPTCLRWKAWPFLSIQSSQGWELELQVDVLSCHWGRWHRTKHRMKHRSWHEPMGITANTGPFTYTCAMLLRDTEDTVQGWIISWVLSCCVTVACYCYKSGLWRKTMGNSPQMEENYKALFLFACLELLTNNP